MKYFLIICLTVVLSGCAKPVVYTTDFYDARGDNTELIGSVVSNSQTLANVTVEGIEMKTDNRPVVAPIVRKSFMDIIKENMFLIIMALGGAAATL